jgi:hypothetical protein
MSSGALADRSRALFAERFPEVLAAIDREPPQSSIISDGGVPIDVLIGDRRAYDGDARQQAATQVDAFIAKPRRLIMETPDTAGLVSEICIGLKLAMERALHEAGAAEIARGPISAPTFLIVFGVGLGYHLEPLMRRTGARWLIVVEPFVEFIGHSFQAVDWRSMIDGIEAAGGDVHIITELDPSRIISAVMHEIAQHGTPYLDGSWVFTHYPVWAFAESVKRLHGACEFAYINRGFFEDELVMMTNAVTNFATRSFWLLDGKPRLHRPETAVIVGAGPSLDEAIETLHRIRDRVVLFSGGTALRPLLRNGLVPDFHCELENGPHIAEVLVEARQHGDFSKVLLIASATVDAAVAPLFDESILFFRDSVSSTRILHGDIMPLNGAAPTCVNTALSAGAALGFTNFVLFGADCGMRPGTHHHAEGTIYLDLEKWQRKMPQRERYPLEVEGNFGGIATTNWVYDASRRMLIDLIATYGLNVVNCSDGALITGAVPRVAEALEIDGPRLDHARIVAELKRSMAHYRPSELLRDRDLVGLRGKSRAMYRDLRAVIDGSAIEQADFAGVFDAMIKFLRDAAVGTYGYAHALPDGSLTALPRIAMFYGCRIADDQLRRRLFATFRDELRKAFEQMERETDRLFERLLGRMSAGAAEVATA